MAQGFPRLGLFSLIFFASLTSQASPGKLKGFAGRVYPPRDQENALKPSFGCTPVLHPGKPVLRLESTSGENSFQRPGKLVEASEKKGFRFHTPKKRNETFHIKVHPWRKEYGDFVGKSYMVRYDHIRKKKWLRQSLILDRGSGPLLAIMAGADPLKFRKESLKAQAQPFRCIMKERRTEDFMGYVRFESALEGSISLMEGQKGLLKLDEKVFQIHVFKADIHKQPDAMDSKKPHTLRAEYAVFWDRNLTIDDYQTLNSDLKSPGSEDP